MKSQFWFRFLAYGFVFLYFSALTASEEQIIWKSGGDTFKKICIWSTDFSMNPFYIQFEKIISCSLFAFNLSVAGI